MQAKFRTVPVLLSVLSLLSSCGETKENRNSGNASDSASSLNASPSSPLFPDYKVVDVSNGGTIRGRVVLEGGTPKLSGFEITANADVCGGAANNNRLQVGAGGGIAWAVVRIVGLKQGKAPAQLSEKDLTVDQVGCLYNPHVIAAPVGAGVLFRNSDPAPHNVRVEDSQESILMNVAQPRQGEIDTFRVSGVGPMSVGCDYHPWMNAYVFGVDNPYYAVTDKDGGFEITGIPPGEYEVQMWLNGFQPTPKKDNRGNIVRYSFSPPYQESRKVTVGAGETREEEFRIKQGK